MRGDLAHMTAGVGAEQRGRDESPVSSTSPWATLRLGLAARDLVIESDIKQAIETGSDLALIRLVTRLADEMKIRSALLELHWGPHECREIAGVTEAFTDRRFQPGGQQPLSAAADGRPCQTLRLLVAPYSDQPGFPDVWKY